MPISINSISTSAFINQAMRAAAASAEQSQKRLASGQRINSAADDPAALVQLTYFNTRSTALTQASKNAQSALAVTNLADNTLTSLSAVMDRITEIVTAAAASNSTSEKASYQAEFVALTSELDRAAALTKSADGTKLLDGTIATTGMSFMVGPDATTADYYTLKLASIKSADLGSATLKLSAMDLTTISSTNSANYLAAAQTASTQLASVAASAGTATRILTIRQSTLNSQRDASVSASESINSIDSAAETANLSKQQIIAETAAAMLAQFNSSRSNIYRTLLQGL